MSKKIYKIVLHSKAVKELKKLPSAPKKAFIAIIDSLTSNPHPSGARKLQGKANAYRIRYGDYRLIYEVHATEIVIYVLGVAHRKEIYRTILPRR